ncbi:hypothetical protein L3i22_025050 [Actinoplanes sp. L3-i22]|nr:hypothetical protein L3i22_025050 [Actinoplanes sp. L3-i22]
MIITGAVAGALLAAGLTGDRWAAAGAGNRLAERLQCAAGLAEPPEVSLGGVPFLTQLTRGRFEKVQVEADAVAVGRFHAGVAATARDVRTAGGSVRAASLTVTAIIRYDEITVPAGLGYDGAGRLRLATTAPLLGREVPVVVHAAPEVTGGSLVVRPVEVEIPAVGIRIPAAQLGDRAAPRTIGLPELPAGLGYQGAEATEDGLRITVGGTHLTLSGQKINRKTDNCEGYGG